MRALVITVILAVVAAAAFFVYRQSAPAPGPQATTTSAPAAPATAADCNILNAVYEYNSDRRLLLRFELIPATTDYDMAAGVNGRQIGNLTFVVHVTSLNVVHKFKPDNSSLMSGPRWQTVAPISARCRRRRFQVSMFDRSMEYIDQLPRDTSTAPAHIYMPDMMRYLYRQHIDLPPGMFSYLRCEEPAAAPATP
jgi:hypothetical protein